MSDGLSATTRRGTPSSIGGSAFLAPTETTPQLVRRRSRRRSRCRLCALQQVRIQPPRFSPRRRLEKSVRAPGTALSPAGLPPYSVLEEPPLILSPILVPLTSTHSRVKPSRPLQSGVVAGLPPTIRVATIGPARTQRTVQRLVESLRGSHRPDRTEYVPEYPGLPSSLEPTSSWLTRRPTSGFPTSWRWGRRSRSSPSGSRRYRAALGGPQRLRRRLHPLARRLGRRVPHAGLRRSRLRQGDRCRGRHPDSGPQRPGLRLQLSGLALVAALDCPVRQSRRCALEAGAHPGRSARTAFIGLAYAYRGDPVDARFVTCCSQIFDADGGGMQFVAYEANDPVNRRGPEGRENPTSADPTSAPSSRSLRVYQSRNGGSVPRQVAVRRLTGFTEDELRRRRRRSECHRRDRVLRDQHERGLAWRLALSAQIKGSTQ